MLSSEARSDGGYSAADRLLHHIALGFRPVLEMSFDIERARYAKAAPRPDPRPVFVAGLARAGTTVIMLALHRTNQFAALSYRDLPFPLAPNSWAKLTSKAHRALDTRERGHGDGVAHDLDSPEAIEEVFWRALEGSRYRGKDGLKPVPPENDTLAAFADYMRIVMLRYGKSRYLSKNNNNILRLPALLALAPDARVVHPFRDPLQQAASLLNQHVRACELHASDLFRRKFMSWLGHHEFGAGQLPFLVGAPGPEQDRGAIDYWLRQWINVHRSLLDQPASIAAKQHFLDYDALCADPARHAPVLARLADVAPDAIDPAGLRVVPARAVEGADPALFAAADAIHGELRARFASLS